MPSSQPLILSFSSSIIIIFIFTFFLLQGRAKSIDPRFEACVPRSCGNHINISFPFWIDPQPFYCGFPGFKLSCKNDQPVLKISDDDDNYYIREIFYNKQSLSVVNEEYLQGPCPHPIHNRTFTRTRDPLNVSTQNFQLYFYYNCTAFPPREYEVLPVSCISNNTHVSFVMVDYNRSLNSLNFSRGCESSVIVPVTTGGGLTGALTRPSDYLALLNMGFLLEWTGNNCTRCTGSGGRCGFNETSQFMCFCPDRPHSVACRNGTNGSMDKKKIIAIAIAAGCFLLAGSLFLLIRTKNWEKKTGNAGDVHEVEEFLEIYGSLALRRYKYSDLKKITNSFKDNLGQGGYGGVFKGMLRDGRLVAVKVLNESKGNGEDFINEVSSIGRTYHVNIVSLLGFCSEGSKRALIYEFMPNGSLEKFIYTEKPRESHTLGWEKLYQIAIGVARGLECLHRGCNTRILHFDIKPHNILLDQDFCPKISDFGLAKLCPTQNGTVSMLGTRGTVGYIAPEVYCRNIGGVSYKSDVYSYGMMILEMVGGRKNIDPFVENTSEVYFPHWIYYRLTSYRHLDQDGYLGLHGIATRVEEETARKMVLVGLWCIQTNPTDRPSMSRVVEMLEGSLDDLQMPPQPFLSSSS